MSCTYSVMIALVSHLARISCTTIQPSRVKLVMRSGNTALVLRKMSGQWDLPGGRSTPAETPAETLARELMEETGITISGAMHLGDHLRLRGARSPVCVAVFGAHVPLGWSIGLIVLSEEHDQAQLVAAHDLHKYDMPELYAVMIRHRLAEKM